MSRRVPFPSRAWSGAARLPGFTWVPVIVTLLGFSSGSCWVTVLDPLTSAFFPKKPSPVTFTLLLIFENLQKTHALGPSSQAGDGHGAWKRVAGPDLAWLCGS